MDYKSVSSKCFNLDGLWIGQYLYNDLLVCLSHTRTSIYMIRLYFNNFFKHLNGILKYLK